jgi:type IV secretory pathway VirB10-like protein
MVQVSQARLERRSTGRGFTRVVMAAAVGVVALQCNTFDDPPEDNDVPSSFVNPIPGFSPGVTETPDQTSAPFPSPPVVTTLPPAPPPPTATTLPGAIDGGLPPDDTAAPMASSGFSGETLSGFTGDSALGETRSAETSFDSADADAAAGDSVETSDAGHAADAAITSQDNATAPTLDAGE